MASVQADPSEARATALRWLPTFLAFPAAGVVADLIAGPSEGIASAALGGLIVGAILGGAQWLAMGRRTGWRWPALTSVAVCCAAAAAAAITNSETDTGRLVTTGLLVGAAMGAVQGLMLGDRITGLVWAVTTTAAWGIGWLTADAIGVDVESQYHVFGASGAIIATALTGMALYWALARQERHPRPVTKA